MGQHWTGWGLATRAFQRLSQLGGAVKERASPVWKLVAVEPGRLWLIDKWRQTPAWTIWIAFSLVAFTGFLIAGGASWALRKYHSNSADFTPIVTALSALAAGLFALVRHFQTVDADRQRRITDNYSKAVEQLGSDKLEVRLGGIYSLEKISKESPADYWTVMETLTAFVRERSRRNEDERAEAVKQDKISEPSTIDIAAVLTVISRRTKKSKESERMKHLYLDLRGAFLRPASIVSPPDLGWAYLHGAHLQKAPLRSARLEGAWLDGANLEEAELTFANLKDAVLVRAILKKADLSYANLGGAWCLGADFEGADLTEADLTGTDLSQAVNLSVVQLLTARGSAETTLPDGLPRPKHCPPAPECPPNERAASGTA